AYPPAAPAAYMPAPAGGYPPPPPPGPARPPMSPQELVNLICMPAGLFFVFLLLLTAFMPWARHVLGMTLSGLALGDAGVFLVLCLLVGALGGLSYRFKEL